MKKFRFKFDRLLNIKKLKEELVQQELSEELAILNRSISKRDGLLNDLDIIYEEMRKTSAGAINIGIMLNSRNQINGYKIKIEKVEREILEQNKIVEKVKKKLSDAVKERKIFEKLKDKDIETWKKEFEDEENLLLDEIGSREKEI